MERMFFARLEVSISCLSFEIDKLCSPAMAVKHTFDFGLACVVFVKQQNVKPPTIIFLFF